MRFTLTDEQRGFGAALGDLLAGADVPAAVRAWARDEPEAGLALWRRLADQGVCGLMVPENAGGLGASPVDLCVAFETLGRHAVPGPWVESAAYLPAALTDTDALASLAEGAIGTVALPPLVPRALDAAVADQVYVVGRDVPGHGPPRSDPRLGGPRPPAGRRTARRRGGVAGPGRCGPGLRPGSARAVGPAARSRRAPAGHDRDLREAAAAVRSRDRLLPGAQAPAGRRPDRARLRPAAGPRCRRHLRRCGTAARPGRLGGTGPRRRRGLPRRPYGAAAARRHRLHRGARPVAVDPQGARPGGDLGRCGLPPRPGARGPGSRRRRDRRSDLPDLAVPHRRAA